MRDSDNSSNTYKNFEGFYNNTDKYSDYNNNYNNDCNNSSFYGSYNNNDGYSSNNDYNSTFNSNYNNSNGYSSNQNYNNSFNNNQNSNNGYSKNRDYHNNGYNGTNYNGAYNKNSNRVPEWLKQNERKNQNSRAVFLALLPSIMTIIILGIGIISSISSELENLFGIVFMIFFSVVLQHVVCFYCYGNQFKIIKKRSVVTI